MADAIGTTVGAMLGTSTVTTFVESATGVAEGGRTGLTAITTGLMFLSSLFFEPLFGSIPYAATAPALIIVGLMMVVPIREINFKDYTESIPAFLTILVMVCASSISDGIMFGIMFYMFFKIITRQFKDLNPAIILMAGLFVIKIVVSIIL